MKSRIRSTLFCVTLFCVACAWIALVGLSAGVVTWAPEGAIASGARRAAPVSVLAAWSTLRRRAETSELRAPPGERELAAVRQADLWSPLRWPSRLLESLLGALVRTFRGHVAIAIMALSLCVKLVSLPVTRLAERWQDEVDRRRAWLEPQLRAIRSTFRGAERSERILALHRSSRISPLYGLMSLLAVAVQLPFFLAAYHALDESPVLAGASFLWISDLSRPDVLPWLARSEVDWARQVHLLPCLMTCISALAAYLHTSLETSPRERVRRRRGMYGVSLGFLLILYTFPAGMVLYWSTNNGIALVRACAQFWGTRGSRALETPHASPR